MEALRATDPRVVDGRYRLLGRLGSGGMGTVYLGRSPGGRLVAVKCVHRELAADPEFRRRFAHELEAVRRVGGFHTAQVVDADPTGDPPWLVTAYIAGLSLAEAVATHGPLSEPALQVLGAGLAEALDAIHAVGLIHRDLKPSNVLLADDGPRVIDFGIARALDGTAITRTQVVIGTPGYMAPEQISGGEIGPACDVFSLGHVLCHAAGCAPFGHGGAQVMLYRVMHSEPDLSALHKSLRPIIAACLARNPSDRPTPAQLLERFAPPSRDEPVEAWLPTPIQPDPARVPTGDAPSDDLAQGAPGSQSVEHPGTRILTAITEPRPALGGPQPGSGRRRVRWIVGPLILMVVATAVCVPLVVLNGHRSDPPNCFPSQADGGSSLGSTSVTRVPVGTPHAPELVGPENRKTIQLGQSITLSWDRVGAVSAVSTELNQESSQQSPELTGTSCTFAPTVAGLYRWSVSSGNAGTGQVGSGWSEDRYLFVRSKGSSTPNPVRDTPDPPRQLAPQDQAVVKAGRPVDLSWSASGNSSRVAVLQPDNTWKSMPWHSSSTYTYTPPSPGVYAWIVSTAKPGDCADDICVSPGSAMRYLIVE